MYVASTRLSMTAILAVVVLTMCGCLKDTCNSKTPSKIYTPVYVSLTALRSAVKSEAPREIEAPGKIYLYGNYIFLNELNKGIHIIDNSDPAAPQKIAFINIPGNVDMAVKGNILYADSYIDLVTLDISNPHNIRQTKRLEFVFPQRQYDYGIVSDSARGLITGFTEKDTVLTGTCNDNNWNGVYYYDAFANAAVVANSSGGKSNSAPSPAGKGGSAAKFALTNDYLFTVDTWGLQVFNIATPLEPVKRNNLTINAMVETIFPYGSNLFIGTQTGMFIYDITNPESPVQKGMFSHFTACDPVVVQGKYAYVTLRSGVTCRATSINELDVVNIENLSNPVLVNSFPMLSPYGLGIENNNLFVCEGANGLRFLNATNPATVSTEKLLDGIEAYDVIPDNNVLLVTAKDGLYQYDYTHLKEPKLLSRIGITIKK